MHRLLNHLKTVSKKHPVVFNSVAYGGICGAAEATQQILERKSVYDMRAISNYTAIGSGFMAPLLYGWYKGLDSMFPGTAWRTIAKKLFMDGVILSIPLYSLFYIGMAFMERQENVLDEWKQKFLPTYLLSMLFWMPMQTINFGYISPKRRVLFIAGCTYVEVNVLCILKRWQL